MKSLNYKQLVVGFTTLSAVSAQAQVSNPSFETGTLSGWSYIGSASVQDSSFAVPTQGSYQAFVNNSGGFGAPVDAATLSGFFGGVILPGNFQGLATDGSGILQTFTLAADSTISFDWHFATNESIGSGYDETFYYVDGNLTLLANSDSLGVSISYGVTGLDKGLPYQTVSIPLSAGTHTLGFGSYDTSDTSVTTGLLIDNITTGEVPEPATAALAGLGIAGLMITRRRK